jgi:CRISPR-associated protein Cas5d
MTASVSMRMSAAQALEEGVFMRQFVMDVWGDLACFTRPEAKVERLSYPVMTPSAARGVFDAIYSKPSEFGWRIDRIEVMNPIQFLALRRNEVKEKIRLSGVQKAMSGGEMQLIVSDATKDMVGNDQQGRTQRQTIALKDVRYRLHAHIEPRPGFASRLRGIEAQAERRIGTGKCFYQPYLGCREFVAFFAPSEGDGSPIDMTMTIGWMVYDVFDLDAVTDGASEPFISLFWAEMKHGVVEVPPWDSEGVRKPLGDDMGGR